MEEEIRFYFSYDKYEELLDKLKAIKVLKNEGCYLELTIQYDHPNKEMSFYDKKIDGRFRLRSSINIENNIEKNGLNYHGITYFKDEGIKKLKNILFHWKNIFNLGEDVIELEGIFYNSQKKLSI